MQKPKTVEDYLDFIDQAIFEINDLLSCAEDESEDYDFAGFVLVYQQLRDALKRHHDDVKSGNYAFGGGADLSFMPLVEKWKSKLPFYGLLEIVNTTQKRGFAAH